MAYNPMEYLEQGNVDFIFNMTSHDKETLIKRIRSSERKKEIVAGFLDKLKDEAPSFCFKIIYDMDEYKETIFYILEKKLGYKTLNSNEEMISNILENTIYAKEYVTTNLDTIISENFNNLDNILNYIFASFETNQELIQKLYLHPNLHIRARFMQYAVKYHRDKVDLIYDDITKYLTSYTHQEYEQLTFLPEQMTTEDISDLAIMAYDINDKELWLKLKEYILTNYKRNDLAEKLLTKTTVKKTGESSKGPTAYSIEKDLEAEKEFLTDANRLFETSQNYKIHMYVKYSEHISSKMLEEVARINKIFSTEPNETTYELFRISNYGLFDKLAKYVDKYLSLSKDTTYEFIRKGSTSATYRVGDYVFKLNDSKWSYEDTICPNLYLILKNLEEDYVRDKNGVVRAGLEVQKYLTRQAKDLPDEAFTNFTTELNRLGYYITDTLINGSCGDNCMLLDTYKDADHPNPEILPEEFKKTPLVLIDRDRVYRLENKFPKQL